MENILLNKSFRLSKFLNKAKKYEISNQIFRSGTSVGANIQEALVAQSRKDFYSKLSIAFKEIKETEYWLRLIFAVSLIKKKEFESLYIDVSEISKILASIRKTMRQRGINKG